MNPFFYLRNVQNAVSFTLRSALPLKRTIEGQGPLNENHAQLQRELEEFLALFTWWDVLGEIQTQNERLTITDIGARDFSFAPIFEKHFERLGYGTEIHGVEIDAYRRYSNLHSRADYGRYYAAQVKNGFYHAANFLKWQRPLHVAFLLHPFVTPEPPLRWGLPLWTFKPQQMFTHAYELLKKQKGILILSNPSLKEFEISCDMAKEAGFRFCEGRTWEPTLTSTHQRPRYGVILKTVRED